MIIDVRGRLVSWSSASTCGFNGTRRGATFVAQIVATNVIRTIIDKVCNEQKS
ncbi:30S ribosomal protein s11 chloroplastic [Phtheirospermum japonicum]|uniref:30S ribosomal protein s11 chloroplastic n=1 Tax=Phtheirospermum japonicum TaxID=374723 RepID=A0A830BGH5_9LAMI|nr:30S ribosomal protein s11 chloroplastic [Phtheirospermum japonicum]